MALFVVQHTHSPEVCPAGNAEIAPMLLQVLAGAPAQGVNILAEAVVDGGHELNLIVTAANAGAVETFMAPFAQMGSVAVRASSPCEAVVDRGAC
ncbi:hypothetical protein AYO38_11130 [bacterium SCGC AG-212-C10]|nr:hypothetical protein AYO38_11130 [bacterium SCGC AG-212-C10]